MKENTANQNVEGIVMKTEDIESTTIELASIKKEQEGKGGVEKLELKVENHSKTVEWKRISAEHNILNVSKTAKSVENNSKMEEHQHLNEENQIGFSVKTSKGYLDKNVSNNVQSTSNNNKIQNPFEVLDHEIMK